MNNPYSAPRAVLSGDMADDDEYEPSLFSVHGRIGRMRYLAYSFSAMFVFSIVVGILSAILIPAIAKNGRGSGAMIMLGLLYIPIVAAGFVMMKRRLNDLDYSGWLSLLILVPILNFFFGLYLMFGPGSAGSNKYGPKPAKNSVLLIIVGLAFPVVMTGILAAVAIPAYKDYTVRAKNAAARTAR